MDTTPSQSPRTRVPRWLLPAVLVVVVGLGAWYVLSRNSTATNSNNANVVANTTNRLGSNVNSSENTNSTQTNANLASNTNSVPSGWLTYTDSTYGFSFRYPSDWRVSRVATLDEISIRDPNAQEDLPSLKAISGGYDDAIAWLNAHHTTKSLAPFTASGATVSIGGRTGRVVTNTQAGHTYSSYAIVVAPHYTLIAYLDTSDPTFTSPSVAAVYQQILSTFQYGGT